jgi:hypothetical protein
MIKLDRAAPPDFLTDEKVAELVGAFKADSSSVWNHPDIKDALSASSHGKCAYCECSVATESKYLEVEHFEYKGKYPDRVVDWENLLPSCKRCNIAKGTHDVRLLPLINPYEVHPKEHLAFRLYRLKGLTSVGASTVEALDLNNSDRLVSRRFDLGEQIVATIEIAVERLQRYKESTTPIRKNKLLAIVETILVECQPTAIYSAGTATIVFHDEIFLGVVNDMKQANLWEEHLEQLFIKGTALALALV